MSRYTRNTNPRPLLLSWQSFALMVFPSVFLLVGCGFSSNSSFGKDGGADFKAARARMVEHQLRQRGIRDERVLQAMATIPRHLFVPPPVRHYAYGDSPLPIGEEQTISQPYIVAFMSESLQLTGTETVLEIGTGSGYQAAVLSHLARQVYSIEILPRLAATARSRLAALGYGNVTVMVGDGNQGWEPASPYAAIIVTAVAPQAPPALLNQLAEGGRMVMPVGAGRAQSLVLFRKTGGKITQENLGPVRFVPLVGR